MLALNPAEHMGGDPHLGSWALDAIGVDTWLKTEPRGTQIAKVPPKEKEKGCQDRQSPLQRRELWEEEEVSAMSNTGPPSQIRAEQTSTGSVMQLKKQYNLRTPACFFLCPLVAKGHRIVFPPSPLKSTTLSSSSRLSGGDRSSLRGLKVLVLWESKGSLPMTLSGGCG